MSPAREPPAYRSALRRHLAEPGVDPPPGASLVAAELADGDVGLAEVVRLHHSSLEEIQEAMPDPVERLAAARSAAGFLAAVLDAYGSSLVLRRAVNARDEERRRVADRIHDEPVQLVTAVGLRLDLLGRQLRGQADGRLWDTLADTVSQATASLRQLMLELRPPSIEREGLVAVLGRYLQEATAHSATTYELEDRLAAELAPATAGQLFQIAQEAIVNAREHARASRLSVLVDTTSREVVVRIRDDGVGFEPTAGDAARRGIAVMHERAALVGGVVGISSSPGAGTTVEVRAPIADRPRRAPRQPRREGPR